MLIVFDRPEVLVSHRNARLTFHGRCTLVNRVRGQGRPVAHVSDEMGVSRQCGHRWLGRFDAEGYEGLYDRSSRPHTVPGRTPEQVEQRVLAVRAEQVCGAGQELETARRQLQRTLSATLAGTGDATTQHSGTLPEDRATTRHNGTAVHRTARATAQTAS